MPIAGEKILARSPGAAVTQYDVEIEHQERVPGALGPHVTIQILGILAAEGVPVAGSVVGGEDPHPVFHVSEILHAGDVVSRAVRIRRIHQREYVREIVGGDWRAADQKVIAIARRLFDTPGRGVGHQIAPGIIVESH